mmetsp:Transcript_89949/g.226915  ORF Transcript_89949/g.226915 Transcript_89949/m.226915 type:complete len:280 (+) Transcript_89949:41-880(+)
MFSTPSPRKRIRDMTKEELQSECRKLSRKVGGTKEDLQYRLGQVKQRNDRGWDRNWSEEASCNKYLASGAERHVYAGVYTKGPRKDERAVKKVFKTGSVYEECAFDADLSAIDEAARLIKAFNNYNQEMDLPCARPMFYLNAAQVWTSTDGSGKKCLVEPRLPGDFMKFNSNTGWVSDSSKLTEALSHFSYHFTGGRSLLCDLQGTKIDSHYLLTDPAVHSLDQEFGATDGGLEAMKSFFSRHRCSHLCHPDWARAAPYGAAAAHPVRMGSSFFLNVRR